MDVHISQAALLHLEGEALDSKGQRREGLLLGHRRGPRYFVESTFPCRSGFFSSAKGYWTLDQHFGDKILGFYFFRPHSRRALKIFRPFAYGKLYLAIRPGKKGLTVKPYVIEYDRFFFLQPISLLLPKGKR